MQILKRSASVIALILIIHTAHAQDDGFNKLSLKDLTPFKTQAGNWMIVGDVVMDPDIDIHPAPLVLTPETGKKKKKAKMEPVVIAPQAVTFQSGAGILLNMNDENKKDNLVSSFEHGDIELELEVMIPKGSNSGIYLQGRYEIQLLDSWGVRDPKYSDIGGIYRNWETDPETSYSGKAPMTNPAKAPGLWQKLKISFRAPRFDAQGKKISNARFVSVELNGIKIHDNVEVPRPTGGPLENNEVALGPLMIQGDHGPVAFRNIQYKLMKSLATTLKDVAYKVYHGNFKVIADYTSLKPAVSGVSPELTTEVVDVDNAYGAVYSGSLVVSEDATYTFTLSFTGGCRLVVNGQQLIDLQRPDAEGSMSGKLGLKAGSHAIEIYNFKDASWMPPRLGLRVSTATSYPQTLNAFNSLPPDENPVSSILIRPGSEIRLLRAFVDFKGDRGRRLTHTIGVGEPEGISYVFDLEAGDLVCVWRGDFVDATPMWHDRGDGSFHPLGAVQYLFTGQPLAYLASPSDLFPATGKEGEFRTKGYVIEEGSGRPVFNYSYQGLDLSDKIYPSDNSRSLTHEVTVKERGTKPGLYYKLAEGSRIEEMPNGLYAIDDKQYYIKIASAGQPVIRDANGKKELVLPLDGSTVKYTIIW